MRSSPLLHIVTRPPLIARVRSATRCSKGRVRVGLRVRVRVSATVSRRGAREKGVVRLVAYL